MKHLFILLLLVGAFSVAQKANAQCYADFHIEPGTVCAGSSVTLSVTPIIGEFMFCIWKDQNGNVIGSGNTLQVVPNGTTWYTGEAYFNGCGLLVSTNLPVIVNPAPTVSISGGSPVCAGVTTTLFANSGPGSTFLWSNGQTGQFITVPAGTYTVIATNGNGCTATAMKVVELLPPATITITSDPVSAQICAGQTVSLTANGGFNYAWSFGGQVFQYGPTVNVKTAGTYTVTATGQNGCTGSASQALTVLPVPTAAINGVSGNSNLSICSGEQTTLTAPYGYTYKWSNNSTSSQIIVNTAGTYSLTVTNVSGCTAVASATVSVTITPDAMINGNPSGTPTTICFGQVGTLTASSGTSYFWSHNGATSQSVTVSSPGLYLVTVYNGTCSSVAKTLVSFNAKPNASITGNISICTGSSTKLTASGGTSYLWSTWSTANQIDVNQVGKYSVTVTDANGCTAVTSVAVEVNQPPHITLDCDQYICNDAKTTIQAGGGVYYIWSTGATTQLLQNVGPGVYAVTVTDANGCSTTKSIEIFALPSPAPIITVSSPNQNTLTLSTSVYNSYKWSTGSTNQSINVVDPSPGLHTYSVTVTNQNGCTGSFTLPLHVKDCPQVKPIADFFGSPIQVCVNKPVTFTDLSTNAEAWSWSFPGGIPSSSNQEFPPSVYYSQPGNYNVSLTVTNSGGSDVETKNSYITVNAGPPSATNYTFNVNGKSVSFNSGVPNTPGLTYFWQFGDGSTSNVQNPTHTYTQSGIYAVKLTISNQCGSSGPCTKTLTIIAEKPYVEIWADKYHICFCDCEWFNLYSTSTNGIPYTIYWHPASFLYYNNPTDKSVETQDAQWLGIGSHVIFADIYDLQGNFVETLSLTLYVDNCVTGEGDGSFKIIAENLVPTGYAVPVSLPTGDYEVYVFDMAGKTVVSRQEVGDFQFTTDGLPSGQYIMYVVTRDGQHKDRKKFQIIN